MSEELGNNSFKSNNSKLSSACNKNIFSKFLDYFWPIYRHELPKFLLITLLMFCILGIQNLVRAMKDSVVNTMIGTETISFLKFWGVLPAAFMITIIYVKLVNIMKGENIFYLIMLVFLSFFFTFAFYLFPNHELLHLNKQTAEILVSNYPHLKWFILLLSNWSFSLFYVIAELWPNAVFALLFWQFVNNITTIDESKRFYPVFGLLGQTGLYLSGQFLINLPVLNKNFAKLFNLEISSDIQTSILSLQLVISIIMFLGVVGLASFYILNKFVLDSRVVAGLEFNVKKKQMSLRESFKMIINSRYIRLITVMLFCYGFAINLVEGPWKYQASMVYKTPTEFAAFVGGYLSYTGILTITFVLLGSNIVRRLGWMAAAIITPLMVFVTGILFFLITNFEPAAIFIMASFALTDPVILAIGIGAVQNVLSKSSKYTLFDSTKEMSYVPLDDQLKTKGKAAADMIGIKLGKSTGALSQSMMFIMFPFATYASISPILMCIFTVICIIWIWAVIQLNKEYKKACGTSL